MNQLFAVSLARMTEDPNDPLVRERIAARPVRTRGRGNAVTVRGAERATDAAPLTISVDLKGIDRRARSAHARNDRRRLATSSRATVARSTTRWAAASAVGAAGGGRGAAGGDNSQNGLYSVSIDGRDRRRIAAGTFAGMQPTADRRASTSAARCARRPRMRRRRVAVAPPVVGFPIERLDDRRGRSRRAAAGATQAGARRRRRRGEQVNFAFNVRVDRRDEWKQILDESYRVMKYRYYDPKMHGKDWAAIYASYSPLLKYAGTNEDVYDIANAMIGELSSSHTGVSGPSSVNVPARLHDALPRLRDGAGERQVSRDARLSRRPGRQGLDRHQQWRLRARHRRTGRQGRRRLLEDPQPDARTNTSR